MIEQLEGLTYIISGILATVILALSIHAYKKSGVKKILYAVIAFASFAIYLFFEAFENFYPILETSYTDIAAALITTLVPVFFFLAIVKK